MNKKSGHSKETLRHTLGLLCIASSSISANQTHTHVRAHTQEMSGMKAVALLLLGLCQLNLQMKSFVRASFSFGGMAAHCVFQSGGARTEKGLTEGVCVCVCGRSPDETALACGLLYACGSSKPVPSSPARRDHLFH